VELHFRHGDVHIVPGDDSHISVTYTVRSTDANFSDKVAPKFEVKGSRAILTLTEPHNASADIELKLPAHTDIYLRSWGGDVLLGAVTGNKDLETRGGDIDIDVPNLASYGPVDASTHAGDIEATLGEPHGWIGKSLKYQGAGTYRLHAHTFAGDVRFHEVEAAAEKSAAQLSDNTSALNFSARN
jgi:hypothetical protein